MKLNDKLYRVMKWLTVIVIPSVGACYLGLAEVWNFPYSAEVAKTATILATFLGAILCISTAEYNRDNAQQNSIIGNDDVNEDDGK